MNKALYIKKSIVSLFKNVLIIAFEWSMIMCDILLFFHMHNKFV